jgi:4-hydroxy-tetrahydrodipicolinate reductase
MTIGLTIAGCCGRMGRSVAMLALRDWDALFALKGALELSGHDALGRDYGTVLGLTTTLGLPVGDDAQAAISRGDVCVDFTTPDATITHVQVAQQLRKPMVIGTTGLSEAQLDTLRAASQKIPIMFSPNMSLGVNALFELARLAAERLNTFDIEVVESHHRQKKDAPSGTAKRLAEVLAAARKQPASAVPVHAVRAGDIVGDHTVILAGQSERLELTHRAHSREVFAQGALKAAQFIRGQRPGLYDMSDVLRAGQ